MEPCSALTTVPISFLAVSPTSLHVPRGSELRHDITSLDCHITISLIKKPARKYLGPQQSWVWIVTCMMSLA
jgi:hypothetical protein